jgi:LacI family transcriptional regulator
MTTLHDIAKVANTSISTVSRVLAGGAVARRISVETRGRVAAAAEQLGYRPNLLARSLRTRRSHTVALLVSDISNPFFGRLGVCIEQQLHKHGYSLIVCNSGEDAALERDYLRLLPQKGIDGLIMVPILSTAEELRSAIRNDLPLVAVDRPIRGFSTVVATDQAKLTTALCSQLVAAGVKNVAMISGPRDNHNHHTRAEVIGKHFNILAHHSGPAEIPTGQQGMQKLRDARIYPSSNLHAIVATNNLLAVGALQAVASATVGPAVRPVVACIDALPLAEVLPIAFVSVSQDIDAMAEQAVAKLMQQLHPAIDPASLGNSADELGFFVSANQAFADLIRAK